VHEPILDLSEFESRAEATEAFFQVHFPRNFERQVLVEHKFKDVFVSGKRFGFRKERELERLLFNDVLVLVVHGNELFERLDCGHFRKGNYWFEGSDEGDDDRPSNILRIICEKS